MPMTDASQPEIGVLVVEDDAVAREAHAAYVTRVPGFAVVGVAATRQQAIAELTKLRGGVQLVLLDMNLPDGHGLEILRAMRAAGSRADVIAVTSAKEVRVIHDAVSLGVVSYLLKPFLFPALRERLDAYRTFRESLQVSAQAVTQADVDRLLAGRSRTPSSAAGLPKGLSQESLDLVVGVVRLALGPLSASEVSNALAMSRVTARRYLEHLSDTGVLARGTRHTGVGRPEVEYAWGGDGSGGTRM